MGVLLGEPGWGAPLLRAVKIMKGRLWRWASLSIGPPLGTLEEDSPARNSERWMKGALGMEHLSLKRISVEGLEVGPLQGALEDMLRKVLDRDSFMAKGN